MIAPEPFFEPRGTPFSEYFRIKALTALGHRVDLVTYPIGEDKEIEGLRIFRSFRPPGIRGVKTGPSFKKIILDFFLFFKALGRLLKEKYDIIHTHEEANIMGVLFNKIFKIPHLYDMHSSLVQQMENFQFTRSRLIVGFFKKIEKMSLKNARSVIVICKSLLEHAGRFTDPQKLTLIENFLDETPTQLEPGKLQAIRAELKADEHIIVMYTGTLEPYQGIPLLLDSLAHLGRDFRLVLIGGKPAQIDAVRAYAEAKGLGQRVMLLGRKPPDEIPYYLHTARVLVSPRILGTNIPLKIYTYLKSGIPVVATNLYTHTQSLTPDIAILTEPEPQPFANGIKAAIMKRGKEVAQNAARFCQQHYTPDRYRHLVNQAIQKAI
jgi:glycosyltransferase involved in cell wall biosynthesis